jgi:hypothetical protein
LNPVPLPSITPIVVIDSRHRLNRRRNRTTAQAVSLDSTAAHRALHRS